MQLGLGHLVRPGPEVALLVHSQKEVGLSVQRSIEERGPVDELGAGAHGLEGCLPGAGQALAPAGGTIEGDGGRPPGQETFELGGLVLPAQPGEHLEQRSLDDGRRSQP